MILQEFLLGDVTVNFDRQRKPVKAAERSAGPYPYYGASGVVDHVAGYLFDGEYLLVAEDGENLRTRKTPVAFIATGKFWANNHAHVLQGNKLANTYYLAYAIERLDISGYLTGSTQPKLTQAALNSIRIKLPEKPEQDAIVAVLRALDDKIAVNDRIAATYEEIFQAKFAALGTAEEGDCDITELVEFNPRTPRPAQDDAVYVDMAALPTRQSSIRTWAHRPPKGGSRFKNGDTLLARITPCLENGKTGFVDFLKEDETGTGSTEFIVMRSRKGVPPEFSYFLARDGRFRKHAIRKMVGSSGRQRVSAADAAHFFVRRPDSGELSAFGAEVGAAFRHVKSLMEESRVLERLRDTLLPELMSGRLRVKDVEKVIEEVV